MGAKSVVVAALMLLALAGCGEVYQVVHAADQTITVSYDEPTQNPDNTPLDDLSHTNAYHAVNGGTPIKGPNVPATSAAGGVKKTATVTVTLAAGKSRVELWATATDTSGNESANSNVSVALFDFQPPKPPVVTGVK